MKSLTKKKTKVWLATTLSVLLTAVLVLSGVGIYFKLKPKGKAPLEVNPLDFSIDAWDGSSVDALNFNGDYAGRGTRTKTIDSAASFVHFVSEVNKGETFETYTIYLNKNIDLAGHTINSIGDAEHPFKGKFDGGHYTIFNANINGNGLFGVVDGAEIKNVGLYNCIINSTGSAGGLIGKAINTDVINSFVRLGSINGSEIGGLIGEYVSNNGEHTISNSFVDVEKDNVNSLIHTLNTNDSQENELTIKYSYLVGSEVKSVANKVSGAYVDDETFINPTKLSDFDKNEWKYDSKYETKETNWCDYDYLNGSDELEFNYPVQKGFVKVFLTGSGYENVVVINGEAENATNLAEAFTKADETVSMGSNKEAEINLLVDKIFMEAKAEVESSNITINAVKNTTIVRGENNEESMFVSSGTSKIVIGGENVNARTNTTATLTLDGNRDYIKENNLESGALIVSNGKGVEIKENVILKNNVNNNIGYGGAVLVCNPTEDVNIDADIKNCSAENGGGVAIIGASGAELKADFSNCSSINGGGAIYIGTKFKQTLAASEMTKLYGENLKTQKLSGNSTTEEYICSGTYSNNTSENGGAIECETGTIILNNAKFTNNSAVNGGAIWAYRVQGTATMTGNSATKAGGAIYGFYKDSSMFISLTGGTYKNNTAENGGVVYTTGHAELGNVKMINNSAKNMAGAIYCGSLNWLAECEIHDNTADVFGDNVCMSGTASPTPMSANIKIGGGYEALD